MVVPPGEGDKRLTRFLGGNPYSAITLPFPGENILDEPAKQVGRQRRLFQREGMKGAWNDDERAVRNFKTQGFMERARGEKVELAVQDYGRNTDRRKLRRQRFEFKERLHQVLQGIDVIRKPALPFDGFEVAELRSKPFVGQIHRQQQVLQVACPAQDQTGTQSIAKQEQLRR